MKNFRDKLGRFVTYHKSGAISFRLNDFLQTAKGKAQLQRALNEIPKVSQ